MSSKIKVDTIENVAGSGNVSLGSGHNLVVPGNITGSGTATITGDLTVDTNTLVVDSTNNHVFIKKTSAAYQTVGHELKSDGRAFHTSSGGKALSLVRNTSNGAIMDFYNSGGTEVGSIETAASGIGIKLGGTASANLLDDYEEGTFTPVAYFGGGTTGITYSSGRQLGQYTKIGDTVYIYIHIQFTSKGSSAGALQIHGLPFTVNGSGHHYVPAKVWIQSMASLNETPTFRFMTGSTVMDCYQMSSNTYSTITQNNCTNSSGFQISGHYHI